jgi:dipeptidyl aminopeptidase/acylaminoacyl peptidase
VRWHRNGNACIISVPGEDPVPEVRPTLERPGAYLAHLARATASLLLVCAVLVPSRPSSAAEDRTATAPPPAAAFGALPANSDVVISPNGKRLAWVDHEHDKPRVVMFDVDARRDLRILALAERLKLRHLVWNDDETLLVTFSETNESTVATRASREYFLNIAYDASGGEGRLLPAVQTAAHGSADARAQAAARVAAFAYVVRSRVSQPHTVIMSGPGGTLLTVDTLTGAATPTKFGNEHTIRWIVDRDGKPVAREDWDPLKRAYRLYALSGESVREILRKDDSAQPWIAGILADDSALVLLAENGLAYQAAWALPLDGSRSRVLAEDPEADITGVAYTSSGSIVGVYVSGSKTRMHWLDAAAQHREEVLQRAFPGQEVSMQGWSSDGSRVLARVESVSAPPVTYLVDFNTHHADIAAEEYPALAGAKLGELKEISYKARDGTSIPAYLTLPPGKQSGPVPLVVLPHGGPQARDFPFFNWVVQFLATRGYAVLQPQFRGSTGFGEAFEKAGYHQWGGLMQDDVSDGVRAMIDQGVADPHRVCIVGMSYGGYAALAGAAFTPTLYSCAASINGVSDLRALMQQAAPAQDLYFRYRSAAQSQWKERIGTGSVLDTKSPINSIAAITTPVMIAYGTGDGVVANEQSIRMAEALQKAGKTVTVVKLPDEDHWLSQAETRTQLLQALEGFLKHHL